MQDLATQWIQAYPCNNKTSQETQRSLQKFLEPDRNPKVIYTDNSLEFGKACEDLSWNHCTSTPHRSETNGIAERAVRRVKEGTSAVLFQSGLNESWWEDTMECYTYLRNVTDLFSDGKTPCERRFGQPTAETEGTDSIEEVLRETKFMDANRERCVKADKEMYGVLARYKNSEALTIVKRRIGDGRSESMGEVTCEL